MQNCFLQVHATKTTMTTTTTSAQCRFPSALVVVVVLTGLICFGFEETTGRCRNGVVIFTPVSLFSDTDIYRAKHNWPTRHRFNNFITQRLSRKFWWTSRPITNISLYDVTSRNEMSLLLRYIRKEEKSKLPFISNREENRTFL